MDPADLFINKPATQTKHHDFLNTFGLINEKGNYSTFSLMIIGSDH